MKTNISHIRTSVDLSTSNALPDPLTAASLASELIKSLTSGALPKVSIPQTSRILGSLINMVKDKNLQAAFIGGGLATAGSLSFTDFIHMLVIMHRESRFNPSVTNVNATGLYQIMPATANGLIRDFNANFSGYMVKLESLLPFIQKMDPGFFKFMEVGGVPLLQKGESPSPAMLVLLNALMWKSNLHDLNQYFLWSGTTWAPKSRVDNRQLLTFIKSNPAIFSNEGAGRQALLTLIHMDGTPAIITDNYRLTSVAGIAQDVALYNSVIHDFSLQTLSIYKYITALW